MNEYEREILRESIYNIKNTWKEEALIEDINSDEEIPKQKIALPELYTTKNDFKDILSVDNKKRKEKLPAVFRSVKKKQQKLPKKAENFIDELMKLDKPKVEETIKLLRDIEDINPSKNVNVLKTAPPSKNSKLSVGQKGKRNELVIRIISTWGHLHVVGLTEVELFDNEGKRMDVGLTVRHTGSGPIQTANVLTNGQIYTNDEKQMWTAYLPLPPKLTELVFTLPKDFDALGGVVIWNYNKNSMDSVKGVREAEILLNGKVIWTGSIKRGQGRVNEDYSTEILLCNNKNVFKDKQRVDDSNVVPQAHTGEELKKGAIKKERNKRIKALIPFPDMKKQNEQQIENVIDNSDCFGDLEPQRLSKPNTIINPIHSKSLSLKSKEIITFEKLKNLYTTSSSFEIPELPEGKILCFDILSTWDDLHYIGLVGIEVFNSKGVPIDIEGSQISAEPKDINVLPGYGDDPRTVDKLVDGFNFTKDDMHTWLTPYTKGKRHFITIDLKVTTAISMIRIWNYNKSRIYSERGVKDVIIRLDDQSVFMGEIRKAPGTLSEIQRCCEVILFTNNTNILQEISKNDWIERIEIETNVEPQTEKRPSTATKKYTREEIKQIEKVLAQIDSIERPLTVASTIKGTELVDEKVRLASGKVERMVYGSVVEVNILETWGDLYYVGLTGIELYNEKNQKISFKVTSSPKDLNCLPGYTGDYRTVDKLIDGINNTTDDKHMWLIPYTKNKNHRITMTLPKSMYISEIKFFNYNKSLEDTYRGAKTFTISVNNKLVTPNTGIHLRKAPGLPNIDFGHSITLPYTKGWTTNEITYYNNHKDVSSYIVQDYITTKLPTGLTFNILLYSTYGDIHYIGLNGLEMYDLLGRPLLQSGNVSYKIYAIPSSVKEVKGLECDIRTLDKLTDGHNDTLDDRHMWLAPLQSTRLHFNKKKEVQEPNMISVNFETQVALSGVRIWNYAKTPSRGVQEFAIFCDGAIIYRVKLLITNIGNS